MELLRVFLKVSCCEAFKWNPFAVLSKGFRLCERERERQRGHIYEGKKVDNGGGEEDEEDKEKNQENGEETENEEANEENEEKENDEY